jgi:hypothetical protein
MKQKFHGSPMEEAQAAIETFQEWFTKICGIPFFFNPGISCYKACSCLTKLPPPYEDAAHYMAYYYVMNRAE